MPTAWLLLATDNEVNQIAYDVQEISVSQCTSAYHCQIKNSSSVVVDIAASSVAMEGEDYIPLNDMSTKMHKQNTTFSSHLILFYGLKSI